MTDAASYHAVRGRFRHVVGALTALMFALPLFACEDSDDLSEAQQDYDQCEREQEEARRKYGHANYHGYIEGIRFQADTVTGDTPSMFSSDEAITWLDYSVRLAELGIVDDLASSIQQHAERWIDLDETAVVLSVGGVFPFPEPSAEAVESFDASSDGSSHLKCSPGFSTFSVRFLRTGIATPGASTEEERKDLRTSGDAIFDLNPSEESAGILAMQDYEGASSPNIESFSISTHTYRPFDFVTTTEDGDSLSWSFRNPSLSAQTYEQTSPLAEYYKGFASRVVMKFQVVMGLTEITDAVDEIVRSCWSAPPSEVVYLVGQPNHADTRVECTSAPIDQPDALDGACGSVLMDEGGLDCQIIRDALSPLAYTYGDGELPKYVNLPFLLEVHGASRFQ